MNRATLATGWARNPDGTLGRTWNPITGCLNHTPEGLCFSGQFPCYAYKLAHGRLKATYLLNKELAGRGKGARDLMAADPFHPRLWLEKLKEMEPVNAENIKPKGIFVCDMADLFGIGVPEAWTKLVIDHAKYNPQHRLYFLTKRPDGMRNFSPFPDNCWIGLTITGKHDWQKADEFIGYCEGPLRFASFEPLLTELNEHILTWVIPRLDWIIIGACTGSLEDMQALQNRYPDLNIMPFGRKWTLQPKLEWIDQIIKAAKYKPIYLKDNLMPVFVAHWTKGYDPEIWSDAELRHDIPLTLSVELEAKKATGLRQDLPLLIQGEWTEDAGTNTAGS